MQLLRNNHKLFFFLVIFFLSISFAVSCCAMNEKDGEARNAIKKYVNSKKFQNKIENFIKNCPEENLSLLSCKNSNSLNNNKVSIRSKIIIPILVISGIIAAYGIYKTWIKKEDKKE